MFLTQDGKQKNNPLADVEDLLEPIAPKLNRPVPPKPKPKTTHPKLNPPIAQPSTTTPSYEQSDKLNGLNPALAQKAIQLRDNLKARGFNIDFASGYRSQEQQQTLYNNRASNPYPVAPPGTSKHEKGLAFDIQPLSERTTEFWNAVEEEASKLGLLSGRSYNDPIHFTFNGEDPLSDVSDLLEEIPKGSGVVDVKEVDDEFDSTQQTTPLEFQPYKGEDLSVFSRTALGASQWASNQPKPKETNSNLLGKPFTLAIKSDGSRIPTLEELNQAMLGALGDSAKIANQRYRQETGRDLIQVNVTPDELQNSFNPETKSFELQTFPSQESIRIINAYLAGGLDAAKAEAARITGERKEYNAELDKAAETKRGWSDTFKAGAADAIGATQQLAYNAATIPEAVFKGEYYGYDSPEYKALEKEDKRNQQAFNTARESIPQEDSTAKSVVRGLESGLIQFPFYANPAAPLVAFTANAHRGVKPATGEAVKMIVAGGGGQLTSGLTKNSSALTNQIVGRSTQGAIGAGGEILSGNTDPRELAESFVTNAAMPLGKRAKESNLPFGRVPRSIFDPATARAPESSFTISKQIEALQNNSRKAVLITPGENMPSIPKGYETTQTSAGTFIFDPKRIPESQIQKMVERNTFHRLLGIVENESAKTDRVVIARDKETGEEIQAAYVSRSNQREQIESFKRQYPDIVIETGFVKDLESKVVDERFKNTQNEQSNNESLNLRLQREELGKNRQDNFDDIADLSKPLQQENNQQTNDTDSSPSFAKRIVDTSLNIWGLPRAIKTAYDLSAPGRQGLLQSVAHPIRAVQSGVKQIRSLFSEKSYEDFKREIRTDPYYTLAEDSGLYFGTAYDEANVLMREESGMQSDLARKIPGIKQSERAYVTYLDNLRLSVFSDYAKALESQGITFENNTDAFTSYAQFLNRSTGRATGKFADKVAPLGNLALFSPRNLLAKAQMLNPAEYVLMNPQARQAALKDLSKYVTALGSTMFVAYLAGAKVTFDPDDSDFGKIRFGNSVYDLTAGQATLIRNFIQLSQSVVRSTRGKPQPKGKSTTEIATRFFRTQLNPSAGYPIDLLTGQDAIGQKTTPMKATYKLFVPMFLDDLIEAGLTDGKKGVIKTLPAGVGIGVQNYPDKFKKGASRSDFENDDSKPTKPTPKPTPDLSDIQDLLEPVSQNQKPKGVIRFSKLEKQFGNEADYHARQAAGEGFEIDYES